MGSGAIVNLAQCSCEPIVHLLKMPTDALWRPNGCTGSEKLYVYKTEHSENSVKGYLLILS